MGVDQITRQDALDAKQDRDEELWWKLYHEIEAEHPDWDGAQIFDEIVRRMTANIEED